MVSKEVMVCAIEGCGEIDESNTAYCIKHGRSLHRMKKIKREKKIKEAKKR